MEAPRFNRATISSPRPWFLLWRVVLMVIVVGLVLIQQGWALVELGRLQQTPVMGLSKFWIYVAIPVGGALMLLYALPPLVRSLRLAAKWSPLPQ